MIEAKNSILEFLDPLLSLNPPSTTTGRALVNSNGLIEKKHQTKSHYYSGALLHQAYIIKPGTAQTGARPWFKSNFFKYAKECA